jgi:hypothetical protein
LTVIVGDAIRIVQQYGSTAIRIAVWLGCIFLPAKEPFGLLPGGGNECGNWYKQIDCQYVGDVAAQGESISEIVRAALESYVADALEEQEDIRVIQNIEARLASGKSRRYTHEEVWAETEESK